MLNDIKDWAIEKKDWALDKGDQTKEFAEGVANEVQTTGIMEWSTSVWLVIGGIGLFMLIGFLSDS